MEYSEGLEKLKEINFPVKLENVYFASVSGDVEEKNLTNEYKAVVGYGEPGTHLKREKHLFSVVSKSYLLIKNEDFFLPIYEGIAKYASIDNLKVYSNKGSFFVEYIIDEKVMHLGKVGILAINSYDGTASSQLNLFIKMSSGGKDLDLFLDFSFKHKHTRGNTYRNELEILKNRVAMSNKLNTFFHELHDAEISREELNKICNSVSLPKMYQEAILNTLFVTDDRVSCLKVYMNMTTLLEGMEMLRKMNFLNNILRGIQRYKKDVSILEFD